jgi:hypothetical protein
MMKTVFKTTALALAAAVTAVPAVPAFAIDLPTAYTASAAPATDSQAHNRDRYRHRDDRRYGRDRYYDERVTRNTRTWRGNDGRYYCRKSNGTTGLIIGAAGGALLGRAVDTRGERATGTILGAAAGALLGREIDRGNARCR